MRALLLLPLLAALGSSHDILAAETELAFSRDEVGVKLAKGSKEVRRIKLENRGDVAVTLHQVDLEGAGISLATKVGKEDAVPFEAGALLDLPLEGASSIRILLTFDSEAFTLGMHETVLRVSHSSAEVPLELPIQVEVVVPVEDEEEEYDPKSSKRPDRLVTEGPQPRIVFEKYVHDFGRALGGEQLETEFRFKNEGDGDLILQDIKRSCKCSVAGLILPSGEVSREQMKESPIGVLKPGESGTLIARLDTTGQPGNLKKNFYVYTNDQAHDHTVTLVVGAELEPAFHFNGEDTSAKFGAVRASDSPSMTLQIQGEESLGDYDIIGHDVKSGTAVDISYRKLHRPKKKGTWHELTFQVRGDAPFGEHLESVTFKTDHAEVKEFKTSYQVLVEPDVSFLGTAANHVRAGMVRPPNNTEHRFAIENHNPAVPYIPTGTTVRSPYGDEASFETEIIEVEKGLKYELVLRIVAPTKIKLFKGEIDVLSDHPRLATHTVTFNGIYLGQAGR